MFLPGRCDGLAMYLIARHQNKSNEFSKYFFWLIQQNQRFPKVILDCIGRTWIAARRQRTVTAKIKADLLCGGSSTRRPPEMGKPRLGTSNVLEADLH